MVPAEDGTTTRRVASAVSSVNNSSGLTGGDDSTATRPDSPLQQHIGDKTTEKQNNGSSSSSCKKHLSTTTSSESKEQPSSSSSNCHFKSSEEQSSSGSPRQAQTPQQQHPQQPDPYNIGKSPGEVAFFKLLHAELKKATHFFERAQQEFLIREERVREGMEIMKQPNSIMVNEKWSLLAKSIYRLYKDLLLLETFCIMAYCSFSKILKKHDKVTGYDTRKAFMANIVNKANFTTYPRVLEMISRCERLYEEVSDHLMREGKEGLYEDERLFINMIHRLNEQVMDTAEGEGVERKDSKRRSVVQMSMPSSEKQSQQSLALRSLVEDNDKKIMAAQVSEGHGGADGDDSDDDHDGKPACAKKRTPITPQLPAATTEMKRQRID